MQNGQFVLMRVLRQLSRERIIWNCWMFIYKKLRLIWASNILCWTLGSPLLRNSYKCWNRWQKGANGYEIGNKVYSRSQLQKDSLRRGLRFSPDWSQNEGGWLSLIFIVTRSVIVPMCGIFMVLASHW